MAGKPTNVEFEENVNRKLRLFMEVSGMTLKTVANEAVNEWINNFLGANGGIKAKYQAAEAKLLASAGPNIFLVKPRKPRKEALK